MADTLKNTIYTLMKEGLYTEEEIHSMINDAAAAVKEEDNAIKVSLDEARASYIKAVYDFYNAIGVKTTMEGAEAQAKFIEKMSSLSNLFSNHTCKTSEDNDISTILNFIKNL